MVIYHYVERIWRILVTPNLLYNINNGNYILVLKTYKEIKPYSSEEIKDEVVEVERYNDDNDEYVYCFLMERAPARSR